MNCWNAVEEELEHCLAVSVQRPRSTAAEGYKTSGTGRKGRENGFCVSIHCNGYRQIKRWKKNEREGERKRNRTRWHSWNIPSACLTSFPPVLCYTLFFLPAACSNTPPLIPYHPAPTQADISLPSPPLFPLFAAVVTHPDRTIAGDFIPMHLPETCALRYGILSLSQKQVDQPKYTS